MVKTRVFISHSSRDPTTHHVHRLLAVALGIPHTEIMCTSVDGSEIPPGKMIHGHLAAIAKQAEAFVFLASPESLSSRYALLELGARWGTGKGFVQVLTQGTSLDDLGHPLDSYEALHANVASDLERLVENVAAALHVTAQPIRTYQDCIALILGTPVIMGTPALMTYIGRFPDFMPHIVRHLNTAQISIKIVTDVACYGHFSARGEWQKYRDTLAAKAKLHVTTEITVLDDASRRQRLELQFPSIPEKSWPQFKEDYASKILALYKDRARKLDIGALTQREFLDMIVEEDEDILDGRVPGARLYHSRANLPVYCWLVDGKRVVLAFPSFEHGATEYGFESRDHNIASALDDMINRLERDRVHPAALASRATASHGTPQASS